MSARPTAAMSARPTASSAGGRPELAIDLAAVADNTRRLAGIASGELMAVVKADGFGHGAADVARVALSHGATRLGVASIDEALALRAVHFQAPILSWLNPVSAGFAAAVRNRIDVAVPSQAHLDAVADGARAAGRRADVHLHIDVGMARDGAEPASWTALCEHAARLERRSLVRVVGVMGHLGWADVPSDPANDVGRRRFDQAARIARAHGLAPSTRHLAATAATVTDPRTHYDLCRVGAGLFGIDPSHTLRLRPALMLTAPVVGVRDVPAGTSVGYGHAYVTRRATRLALLPIGYADGLPRIASGRASALLNGRRRPVAGLISMDQTVVDVGSDTVELGQTATFFGPGDDGEPTVADWARWASTIEHEIVTGIGTRVARRIASSRDAHDAVTVAVTS
jgi:alanine racemase